MTKSKETSAPVFTQRFSKIRRSDKKRVGGKGVSLAEMNRGGIPIPDGFVILTNAFDHFLDRTKLRQQILAEVAAMNDNELRSVERTSKRIRRLIQQTNVPGNIAMEVRSAFHALDAHRVAVRSSAVVEDGPEHAWAGQFDSFLNVPKDLLLDNVKRCWSSLFTPRAMFYRLEKNIRENPIAMAVVIQKMIESEKSGVAFSVHPVSQDKNKIIIEAGIGLGEAVVSGSITPDAYIVEKNSHCIASVRAAEQKQGIFCKPKGGVTWRELRPRKKTEQVLADAEILELSALVKKIENLSNFPCDIEWAQANNAFHILQSRPITLTKKIKPPKPKLPEKDYELHFTASDLDILSLDMIFNNDDAYGEVDYIVLYENNIVRAYLSPKGVRECFKISASLLNDAFFHDLLLESELLHQVLRTYKAKPVQGDSAIQRWKEHLALSKRFSRIYRYYEQPFQRAIEAKILSFISNEDLMEILLHRSLHRLPNDEVKKLVERLLTMGDMKLRLHEASEAYMTDDTLLQYVSDNCNVPLPLVGAMCMSEFGKALRGKMTVTVPDLEDRSNKSVFIKERKEWNLYTGKRFDRWKKKLREIRGDEISGDVAFPGIVSGRVVIHLSWNDTTELRKGDVLVTGMTNPQMIPFLKKAAAIITDEGGITCHAAIISRELQKPCIVGTKHATQILRDGDIVEVNAREGRVRILSKKMSPDTA